MADCRRCALIRQASLKVDAESHDGSLTRFHRRSSVHDGSRAQQRHCIRRFLRATLAGKPLPFRTILPPGELTPNRSSCSTSTVPNGCVFVASLLGLLSSNLSVWAEAGPYLLRVRTTVTENLACFSSLTLSSAGSVIKSTSYYVQKVRHGCRYSVLGSVCTGAYSRLPARRRCACSAVRHQPGRRIPPEHPAHQRRYAALERHPLVGLRRDLHQGSNLPPLSLP